MMGVRKGVATLLKNNVPWLVEIQCLAHKLELAIKECLKGTYMDSIVDILTSVYYFYKGSPKPLRELEEIAEFMEEHFLKPERANGTRWVEHKQRALCKLEKNWGQIVLHLENYATDTSNAAEDRAKAKGIHTKLVQYKLVLYMYFLLHLFDQMAQLSLLFQQDDITVPSVVLKVENVQLMLTSLLTVNGPNLDTFYATVNGAEYKGYSLKNLIDHGVFERDMDRIIGSLLAVIDRRFSNVIGGVNIYRAAQIFDPRNWSADQNELVLYGRNKLGILLRHFSVLLTQAHVPIQDNIVYAQWSELKVLVNSSNALKNLHPNALWQRIFKTDQDREDSDYSQILKVIFLTELYPLSTACCDRGFSTMKKIKTDWRCRLATETLDDLMRVKISGSATVRDFEPRPVVNRW